MKMNDVDFIKRCCEYADGFELSQIKYDYGTDNTFCGFDDFRWNIIMEPFTNIMYPLLLQRAIEGVNLEHFNKGSYTYPYEIKQMIDGYMVKTHDRIYEECDKYDSFNFSERMDHDQAKRSALEYIFTQDAT